MGKRIIVISVLLIVMLTAWLIFLITGPTDSASEKLPKQETKASAEVEVLAPDSYSGNADTDPVRPSKGRIMSIEDLTGKTKDHGVGKGKTAVVVTVLTKKEGKPIPGQIIKLYNIFAWAIRISGENGQAYFEGVPGGRYQLAVQSTSFASEKIFISVPKKTDQPLEITVYLSKGSALSGMVIDEDHRPVAGARVTVFNTDFRSHSLPVESLTRAEGRFSFKNLPPGAYSVSASHDDYVHASAGPFEHGDGPTSDIEIVLRKGGMIKGVVFESNGSRSVGTSVLLAEKEPKTVFGGFPTRNSFTGEDGLFEFKKVPKNKYLLYAKSERGTSKEVEVNLLDNSVASNIELRLEPLNEISGRVVDSKGKAASGVWVSARVKVANGTKASVSGFGHAKTDKEGQFTISGLSKGTYSLSARRPLTRYFNYSKIKPTIAATGDENVLVVLRGEGSIQGTVRYVDGTYPDVFQVILEPKRLPQKFDFSGDKGAFEIEHMPPGKLDLKISGSGFTEKLIHDVQVQEDEITDLGVIQLWAGRSIRGVVIDADGTPVDGAKVTYGKSITGNGDEITSTTSVLLDGANSNTAYSDQSGSFEIMGVDGQGGLLIADHRQLGRSELFPVPKGKHDVEAKLTLMPVGGLQGRVFQNGVPVKRAIVQVTDEKQKEQRLEAHTFQDGRYSFRRICPGPKSVQASWSKFIKTGVLEILTLEKRVDIHAGRSEELDFELSEGQKRTMDFRSPSQKAE